MKILVVNKFFFPFAGAESSMRSTMERMISEGHEVVPFSMQDPRNWPSEWSDYFVRNVDYKTGKYGLLRQMSEAGRIIYSFEAKRKITALIEKTHPDLAHCHNIYHHISPSILPALRKAGIPTVMSLHDAKLLCPAYQLYTHGDICEKCAGSRFYHCLLCKCVKDSRLKSLISMIEMYLHTVTGIYERNVDVFITPSEFYRGKLLETGRVPPERVVTVYNSVDVASIRPVFGGNHALFLGQVEEHKGLRTLLRAMKLVPGVHLKIVGKGSMGEECARLIDELNLTNVEMLGFQTGEALDRLMREAAFLVAPSEWYENCPMVVIEAAAHGKPAVVTNLGGQPELVRHEETGFVVAPRNPDELAGRIAQLGGDDALVRSFGRGARENAERRFSRDAHFRKLLEAYKMALRGKNSDARIHLEENIR